MALAILLLRRRLSPAVNILPNVDDDETVAIAVVMLTAAAVAAATAAVATWRRGFNCCFVVLVAVFPCGFGWIVLVILDVRQMWRRRRISFCVAVING